MMEDGARMGVAVMTRERAVTIHQHVFWQPWWAMGAISIFQVRH